MPEVIYTKEKEGVVATFKAEKDVTKQIFWIWKTEKDALNDLIANDKKKKAIDNKYWVKIIVCEMHDEMPHEILTASLRSKKPFSKKMIEDFIAGETTMNNIKKVANANDQEIKIIYVINNN